VSRFGIQGCVVCKTSSLLKFVGYVSNVPEFAVFLIVDRASRVFQQGARVGSFVFWGLD